MNADFAVGQFVALDAVIGFVILTISIQTMIFIWMWIFHAPSQTLLQSYVESWKCIRAGVVELFAPFFGILMNRKNRNGQ